MFTVVDRVWSSVERDKRRSFLNYYFLLLKLLELMKQTKIAAPSALPQNPIAAYLVWKNICDELGLTWKQTEKAYANHSVEPRQGQYKRKPKGNI
jgi:hypothetical protein